MGSRELGTTLPLHALQSLELMAPPPFLLFFPSPKIGTWVIVGLVKPLFMTSKPIVLFKELTDFEVWRLSFLR